MPDYVTNPDPKPRYDKVWEEALRRFEEEDGALLAEEWERKRVDPQKMMEFYLGVWRSDSENPSLDTRRKPAILDERLAYCRAIWGPLGWVHPRRNTP